MPAQDDRAGAPLLLAPSGERLALRHEMRRPFAAWLGRQAAAAAQGALLGEGWMLLRSCGGARHAPLGQPAASDTAGGTVH